MRAVNGPGRGKMRWVGAGMQMQGGLLGRRWMMWWAESRAAVLRTEEGLLEGRGPRGLGNLGESCVVYAGVFLDIKR